MPNKTRQAGSTYVERFRFTPMVVFTLLLLLAIAVSFVVMAVDTSMGTDPLGLAVVATVLVFAGGLAAFLLVTGWKKPVVLRLDAQGVTFGRPSTPLSKNGLWFRVRPVTVPWAEIDTIVLFTETVPGGGWRDFIGVCRRPDAPPVGEPHAKRSRRPANRRSRQRTSLDDVGPLRQIYGWRVDRNRLKQVARKHAPHVSIVQC